MGRREELTQILKDNAAAAPLIEEILYLENQLDALRALPKIRVNPDNPEQQKITPAAKLYKEYLQQYLNALKLLLVMDHDDNDDGNESPLRKWAKQKIVDTK